LQLLNYRDKCSSRDKVMAIWRLAVNVVEITSRATEDLRLIVSAELHMSFAVPA